MVFIFSHEWVALEATEWKTFLKYVNKERESKLFLDQVAAVAFAAALAALLQSKPSLVQRSSNCYRLEKL